jgi:uncharacterized peroxidase-related enzyme
VYIPFFTALFRITFALSITTNKNKKNTIMTRLTAVDPNMATGKVKDLFTAINGKLGMVPNMMRTMGNSPALLEGYLNFSGALGSGTLGAKTGELIALAVAESNQCDYCLSAHTYIGANLAGIDEASLTAARNGHSTDAKTKAALQFAKTLTAKKGLVNDADLNYIKAAGFTEGEIGEIVGHVALNILTNYFNNTAATAIDFPVVEAVEA